MVIVRMVPPVHADVDRRRRGLELGQAALEVPVQRRERDLRKRRDGVPGRRWVRGVCLDQQDGALAAHQPAAEILRDRDGELHLAEREQPLELVFGRHLVVDAEVAARLQCRDQAPRIHARVGAQHRGRQPLGVGIDRVAEEDELQHRDADDHAEGEPVAPELDELLDDDPEPALQREPLAVH
jgi:hypothetical protein